MKNIFILGNGFDLAHGFDTDYWSFIEDIVAKERVVKKISSRTGNKSETYPWSNHKFKKDITFKNKKSVDERNEKNKEDEYNLKTDNSFLVDIIHSQHDKNWGGIEKQYFDKLIEQHFKPDGRLANKTDHHKLNKELDSIKKELENYLSQFNECDCQVEGFGKFFKTFGEKNKNLILNFNYTSTFERFYKFTNDYEVVNIHGQIGSTKNPIIFGYAPSDEETQELIDRNDNEYLKNIKRYYYKQTLSEKKLKEFIGDGKKVKEKINVFIIGHSCGLSDRHILKDIFTHSNVLNINIVYYKDYQGFFDTLVNIDRIIGKTSDYNMIRNFEFSIPCPQINDNEDAKKEFNNKLEVLLKDISNNKVIVGADYKI